MKQQGLCKEEEQKIINLHIRKQDIFQQMEIAGAAKNKERLKELAKQVTDLEFSLQRAWRFTEDINFHKFWEMPFCGCAKIDNNDAWPTGYYSRDGGCMIHGDEVNKRVIEFHRKEEATRSKPEAPLPETITIPKTEYFMLLDRIRELENNVYGK